MTRFDAKDPATEPSAPNSAQGELRITRVVVCGDTLAGKSAFIERLQQELPSGSRQAHTASEAAPEMVGARFHTARHAYVAVDAPWDAGDAFSTAADLAIILIDSSAGVGTRARRDSYLLSLAGIRHVLVAVDRTDLTGYPEESFEKTAQEYRELAVRIGLSGCTCIPVSAPTGDNLVVPSSCISWYRGPTLTGMLDSLASDEARLRRQVFRLPVERVEPPRAGACVVTGTIASGSVRRGLRIRVQPRGSESTVVGIATEAGDAEQACADRGVALTLADAVEISRGDVICAYDAPAPVANQFEATVVWMSEQPLLRGRSYRMQCGTNEVTATVAPIKHRINVDSLDKVAANKLERNEIGEVALELDRPIAFDPYRENWTTGGFVLIDRIGRDKVGMGMLHFALRRADNLHWQALEVDKPARQALAGHRSGVVWMTGLSGAGKSTLANMLEKRLHARGMRTYLLDGDNVRHGLNKDLGFTAADRVENIRRVAEVARLMVDAGIIVITAFISPFRAERRMARELMKPAEFIEIFVDTPLETAESRDRKGLYGKARRGELKNFTGIDSPYEVPEDPEVRVDTVASSIDQATQQICDALVRIGLIDRE